MPNQCFPVKPDIINDRIDAHFYNPEFFQLLKEMKQITQKNNTLELLKLDKLLIDSENDLGITGGATPLGATYLEEGITFIRVQNVRRNKINLKKVKYIPELIHNNMLKRSQLKPDDVLLTITGMTYGLSAVVPPSLKEANMNQHSVRMRIKKDIILPSFLSFFLNSKFGRIQTDRYVTGSTRPALDYVSIRNISILKPNNTNDQKKIMDKVDNFIVKSNQNTKDYELLVIKIPEIILNNLKIEMPQEKQNIYATKQIEDRFDAKYYSPFLNKLKQNIMRFPHEKLGKITEIDSIKKIYISDSYRLVELDDIDEELGLVKRVKSVLELASQRTVLKKDRVIISKLQPDKGKAFIVDEELEGCIGSGELVSLKVISDMITKQYLWCILRSPYILKQWEYQITGSTRERIGKDELLNTIIPLPDDKTQEKIVLETEKIIKEALNLKRLHSDNIRRANEIFVKMLT